MKWSLQHKTIKPMAMFMICIAIISFFILKNLEPHNSRLQNLQANKAPLIKPIRIFQLGFSKCGTGSIAAFFQANGIPAVHHDDGHLPWSINENHRRGRPLISPRYNDIYVFTDMEAIYMNPQIKVGQNLFRELDKQHPGSKFILNTRNKAAWLKSRAAQPIGKNNTPLLEISASILNISRDEMLKEWSQEWDEHHKTIIEYFKDRPNDLLIFNIEQDPPEKMRDFFKDNFKLDAKHWSKTNDSKYTWLRLLAHKFSHW
jgi:hypothetical protein